MSSTEKIGRPGCGAVEASALWAAWGDALGFVTELTESRDVVAQRLGADLVTTTERWKRRVGGRFGPVVELPAGCYSDDTQLRLAAARAIRGSGRFNVEAFSKVELPVFLAYQLGAGRATKAAAQGLVRRNVRWSSNFFNDEGRYVDAGGNGAAMRIQPHVWAWPGGDQTQLVEDVVVNAVCTHGHPLGILGAVFHALALRWTLQHRQVPDPDVWRELLTSMRRVPDVVARHDTLAALWAPLWEKHAERELPPAFDETVDGALIQLELLDDARGAPAERYEWLVHAWRGFDPAYRGAGLPCALLASAVAWLFRDDPRQGLVTCANLLGSDTDTIATMAGALLGAVVAEPPPGVVMDTDYIRASARRLWRISQRESVEDFVYPDLLRWTPPRATVDVVGEVNGEPAIAGLGSAHALAPEAPSRGKDDAVWQWLGTHFGQSVLAKRRRDPRALDPSSMPLLRPPSANGANRPRGAGREPLVGDADEGRHVDPGRNTTSSPQQGLTLDGALKLVQDGSFDAAVIGRMLLRFADEPNGSDLAAAFGGMVAREMRRQRRAGP